MIYLYIDNINLNLDIVENCNWNLNIAKRQ